VALINCTDITAKNLNISDNRQGILLVSTTESSIMESNLSNNCYGIQLEECADISILGNSIENSLERGIYLRQSNNNIINNNAITKSGVGIQIGSITRNSDETNSNNQIVGNSITENACGIRFAEIESINMFYHNSLINNTKQVDFRHQGTSNTSALLNWDTGVEGNYWSDYAGSDTNYDGIGDTEYLVESLMTSMIMLENGTFTPIYINITDRYPLSGMFSSFTQSGQTFNLISNSTIQNFQYRQAESTITLQANTEGFGFCRIAIPHTAMNKNSISAVINEGQVSVLDPNYQLYDDGKRRWIYFAYPEGTQQIQITAETP
jgi:parallel beta-helix repeat protein